MSNLCMIPENVSPLRVSHLERPQKLCVQGELRRRKEKKAETIPKSSQPSYEPNIMQMFEIQFFALTIGINCTVLYVYCCEYMYECVCGEVVAITLRVCCDWISSVLAEVLTGHKRYGTSNLLCNSNTQIPPFTSRLARSHTYILYTCAIAAKIKKRLQGTKVQYCMHWFYTRLLSENSDAVECFCFLLLIYILQ